MLSGGASKAGRLSYRPATPGRSRSAPRTGRRRADCSDAGEQLIMESDYEQRRAGCTINDQLWPHIPPHSGS